VLSPRWMPHFDEVGNWWDRIGKTEVDVVATDRRRFVVVGSCRWSQRAGTDVLDSLVDDARALGPAADGAQRCIFARGFDRALARRASREGVRLIDADELLG